ncbi:MAG: hypothetical protein AUK53_06330 [Betaproteobacteria bacterium CG2_30_59_46]|nr:MAG: hypothetical protein AUK53_06330 [Betaproteobacteria bacterium CG2_30_59_46]PIQ12758.1 MAG: hypothetical protein COW70_08270 [Hydrogenophilales bacterium CG18_big_fil_WC_8_21_14_2_50_58_12]PIY00410.1 MAG: hypothetical protein COZ23_08160 [Hydrogenophilales bacterium CG_4_10_14_3_um_filter_58_23]PJB06091.1 MAG: hypothetical protein CO125_07775 [Hydrogenophilales bacterium CG_4_9_14_3_um_filter_59_35]
MKQEKQPSHLLERYPTRVIAIGFGLVVVLMLALVVFSLSRLSTIRVALDEVAEEQNQHSAMAYTMYNVSRERAFLFTASRPIPTRSTEMKKHCGFTVWAPHSARRA